MLRFICFIVIVSANKYFQNVAAGVEDLGNNTVRISSRISERKCEEYSRGTTCKSSYDDIDPTMVEPAKLGEFPHLAFIATNKSYYTDKYYPCVGSLISPRFVVTAAQCTGSQNGLLSFVTLGGLNGDPSVDDGANPVQIPIKNIIKHPEYRLSRKYNDIVLLELAYEVTFNANIRPACLWTEQQTAGHTKAVISTIDRLPELELKERQILKVSVTVKEPDACNVYSKSRRWNHGMDATQLCGQEATGSTPECRAIGGAPLQIITNAENSCTFRVIGLASFGSSVCDTLPTVFTRISSYVDWIESIVWAGEQTSNN